MLAVFEKTQTCEKKWYKRLFENVFGVSPIGVLELVSNVPFIKISCEEGKNGFPWRRISEISLDCSGRMLMPNGIFPPPDCDAVRFVPEEYPFKMLEKLAVNVVRKADIQPQSLSLALCGDYLFIQRALPVFIEYAADIRVISRDAEKLADFIDGTTELTGASIMLSKDISRADPCHVVIAPNGIDPEYRGREDSILFAPKKSLCFGTQIMQAEVRIPPWLKSAYKDCYDKMEFLSAFYEISRARGLEELEPVGGLGKYGSISTADIIKSLLTMTNA